MKDDKLFKLLLAALQSLLVLIAGYGATKVDSLSTSVNTLNVQIAVLIANGNNTKVEIGEMKQRLSALENRGK